MSALYNEIEPFAADWLVNLAREGHIAGGSVERRSIVDLKPADVGSATQFHAFAGIGCWSLALRLAGVADDDRVWTGSCPCQPFSAAGRRGGFDDDRHLWPEWFRLIRECRPPIVFGEQVASADGLTWLDAVFADMEGAGYACAAADLCAAGVGAPHIRQRLYFVAYATDERHEWRGGSRRRRDGSPHDRDALVVADAHLIERGLHIPRRESRRGDAEAFRGGEVGDVADTVQARRAKGRPGARDGSPSGVRGARELGDAGGTRGGRDPAAAAAAQAAGQGLGDLDRRVGDVAESSGATRGFWRDAEWIQCTDGKARPTEPGTFPLAHGSPARVGKLRAYGNAIVAQVAAEFIRAALDSIGGVTP